MYNDFNMHQYVLIEFPVDIPKRCISTYVISIYLYTIILFLNNFLNYDWIKRNTILME